MRPNRRQQKKVARYKARRRSHNHPRLSAKLYTNLNLSTMSSAISAALPPKDGPRGGDPATKPSAGLGSYSVHQADGMQRPNYGKAMIDAADRRHDTDPAIRSRDNWL